MTHTGSFLLKSTSFNIGDRIAIALMLWIWWQLFLTQVPKPPIWSDWYIFVEELNQLFGQADIILL